MKSNLMKQAKRVRRVRRVRARVKGVSNRPRLAVCRSLKHISAQIIDDTAGKTLVAVKDTEVKAAKGAKPTDVAREVGKAIAEKAKGAKIASVVFDRRDKRYHGRVKALADGAREGGLVF